MVLLGKLWYERQNYDHIIVDMPSTGHALTMLHTPFNFANLFPGGPIYNDSHEMIATFSNPNLTSFIILSLAEEMPSQESYELQQELLKLMPKNPAKIIYNRIIQLPNNLIQTSKSSIITKTLDHLKRKEAAQQQVLSQFLFLKPDFLLTEIPESSDQQRIEGLLKQLP